MREPLSLVILAAGMGSRYGGLKQLDGFGPSGETLLEYSIFDALQAGFERTVFVIRHDIEAAFKDRVASRFASRVPCAFTYQEHDLLPEGFTAPAQRTRPWGTGHAVLAAQDEISGPFAVINADDYYGPESFQALAAFFRERTTGEREGSVPEHALVGYRLDRTLTPHGAVSRAIAETDSDHQLTRLTEHTRIQRDESGAIVSLDNPGEVGPSTLPPDAFTSINLFGFTPAIMSELEKRFRSFLGSNLEDPKAEFYLPAAVNGAIQAGSARVTVIPTAGRWFGVTYPEDRPLVADAILRRVEEGFYPRNLWLS